MYTCMAATTIALAPNHYNDIEEGRVSSPGMLFLFLLY